MPRIPFYPPTHPDRPDQSMLVTDCARLLQKMGRELGRFAAAHDDLLGWSSDHGINFAISATQMIDWFLEEQHLMDAERIDWVLRAKCVSRTATREALLDRIRNLKICRAIAISAKHVTNDRYPVPDLRTFQAFRWRRNPIERPWIIECDGQCRQAVAVFRETLNDWRAILGELFVVEAHFVAPRPPDRFDHF